MHKALEDTLLDQQTDTQQRVFEPSEVMHIDYWLLHHSKLDPKQELKIKSVIPRSHQRV
jgi:hypothetical protein